MSKGLVFLTAFLLVGGLCIANTASAQSFSSNYQTIILPEGDVVEDNFVRFGNDVIIDGQVNGDVIVGANSLIINGDVAGDVIAAAANKITINGKVAGNVRVASTNVEINSAVGKNVNIAANTARLGKESQVGWTLSFATNSLSINGPVGGNLYGYGNSITVNNTVGSNATLYLGETGHVTLMPNTILKGNFEYTSDNDADIQSGAEIEGNTVHKMAPEYINEYKKFLSGSWIFAKITHLFGILLIGVIIITLLKSLTKKITQAMWSDPSKSMLLGLICLIVTPIALIIVTITIIGIPLALISMAIYLILIYLAQIFIGTLIGQKILNYFNRANKEQPKEPSLLWAMILGTVIYMLLINIPYIGFLIGLIGTIWFLGSLWQILKKPVAPKQ